MNKLDQKYVDEVNEYLATPLADREIEKGAMLMLKGNRNQTLHKNVIRRSWHEKVEYELKKILGNKILSPQVEAVAKTKDPLLSLSNKEVDFLIKRHLDAGGEISGKRADHELLPTEIKDIPDANRVRYQEMRSLHEKLKLMNAETFMPEDREPILKELLKLDVDLRANWDKYDTYVIGQPVNEVKTVAAIDAKRIGANRTFLSRQAKKQKLSDEDIAETQNRFDEMIANDVVVSPEITEKLKTLGIKVAEISPEVTEENKPEEITEAAAPVEQKNTEDDMLSEENQSKAEAIICESIKGMLKSNLDAEVIKNAFSGVEKVGDKDLSAELLQELIEAATAELAEQDVDDKV